MASKYFTYILDQQHIGAAYTVSEDKVEIFPSQELTDAQITNILYRYDINPHIDSILADAGWDYKKLTKSSGKTKNIGQPLLKSVLTKLTKENMVDLMGTGGRLSERTGRFRNSVRVTKINDKDIYFTYKKKPYSVFDPKVSKYHGLSQKPFIGARDPKKLISEALDKAAREMMNKRFNIKQG